MTEIRFYHLQGKTPEQALPDLLTKALSGGRRIVVRCADKARVESLNEYLWTFRPDSFLPHGSAKDGFAERQPVWLTDGADNPNLADVLVLADGADSDNLSGFALVCDVFDGRDEAALEGARSRWKHLRDSGHEVTYWQQTDNGWEKKA